MRDESFTEKVFDVVRRIPRGKVATYGQVATLVGSPRSARYVGWALRRNTRPVETPCYRVVFKDGSLAAGYVFGGEGVQRKLLEEEGVAFTDEGRVDMAACAWDGRSPACNGCNGDGPNGTSQRGFEQLDPELARAIAAERREG
ncbi:MAG: MGMT family protein [Eggerthellaceae bacterium]|nr:MGMT family protein [Eggerthellaceae bacterium]